MKFIKYTYVDYTTGIPVSKQPAQTGPTHPKGVTPTYAIEESFSTGIPVFYGIAEDDYEPEEWMHETDEDSFFATFKEELKARARNKKTQIEEGGVLLGEQLLRTDPKSQDRVGNLVTALNNDPEMTHIDFEAQPGQWVDLDRETGFLIGKLVSRHVQQCFSWCRGVHEQIDSLDLSLDTMGDVIPILQEINSFGASSEELPEEPSEELPEEPSEEEDEGYKGDDEDGSIGDIEE